MSTQHTTRKRCDKCNGRSFMNGFCLTCEHKQANRANRGSHEGSILAHCEASLERGFVEKSPAALAKAGA